MFAQDLSEGHDAELEACQVLKDFTGFPWFQTFGRAHDLESKGGTAEVKFDRYGNGRHFYELFTVLPSGVRPSGVNAYGPADAPTWWCQGDNAGWRVYPYMDLRKELCRIRAGRGLTVAGDGGRVRGLLTQAWELDGAAAYRCGRISI
jgi:hypothetical protein